eukprot:COSAG02_NODE_5431_length_4334_cov_6.607084_2_plen_1192_part_01
MADWRAPRTHPPTPVGVAQESPTHPPARLRPRANTHPPTTDLDWETKCPQGAEERNPVLGRPAAAGGSLCKCACAARAAPPDADTRARAAPAGARTRSMVQQLACVAALLTGAASGVVAPVTLQQDENHTWWFSDTRHRSPAGPAAGGDTSFSLQQSFVSAGVDHVMWTGDNFGPPSMNAYEQAVQRKYDGNRTAWAEAALDMIAGANFNTLGSWSSATCPDCWEKDGAAQAAAERRGLYYTPIVLFTHEHNVRFNTTGFPDVFDATFNESAWETAQAICAPRAHSNAVLGYFLDNEGSCPPYPETSTSNLRGALESFLLLPAGSPGRKLARIYHAQLSTGAKADTVVYAEFAALVARQYFQITTAAIRHFDPNHLILGCKFTNGDGLTPLIEASAPFVDAHALDVYAFTPGVHYMRHMYERGGRKPFIVAEFSFQARENFVNRSVHLGGAGPLLQTQAQRAAAWSNFVEKLLALEFVVGYHHFQYFDQPSNPANPRNTNYGIVSVNDTVYSELLETMRVSNRDAASIHAAGAAGQVCAIDQRTRLPQPFRGSIRHNSTGLCLTATGNSFSSHPVLMKCTPALAFIWDELPNGRLRHMESTRCLDLDRSVSQSTRLVLTENCSTDIAYEVPASWEHGADCMIMNFCRWMGTPACAYGQTCLAAAAPLVALSEHHMGGLVAVESTLCVPGTPSLAWSFISEPAWPRQESATTIKSGLSTTEASGLSFRFRCRATPVGGTVVGNLTFAFFSSASRVNAVSGQWSEYGNFTAKDGAHYPQPFPPYPIKLVHMTVSGLSTALTEIDVEIEGTDVVLHARVFGSSFGMMVTQVGQPDGPVFWTLRQYNAWKYFQHFPNASTPPTQFEVVGRFIGGSDDLDEWVEGVSALLRTGFRGVALPPNAPLGLIMEQVSLQQPMLHSPIFSGGVYSSPGGAFDFDCGNSTADVQWKLDTWASQTAAAYHKAGLNLSAAGTFALADEPGWYFPAVLDTKAWPARVVDSWQTFLRNASLTPDDVGAKSWAEVKPIGRSQATTLPLRRLYYWSTRFFSTYSAQHFAAQTRAMESHFHSGMTMFVNWNNFAGRLIVPGPLGNNPQKSSPNTGYGSHDWFDFGRARGTTCLWTEDWFGAGDAWQWSLYANRLRGAAALAPSGDVTFGGYIVGRDASPNGLAQKMLALAGSGAKAMRIYTFGPEYMFPQ